MLIRGACRRRVLERFADLLEVEHAHFVVLSEGCQPVRTPERGLGFRGLKLLGQQLFEAEVQVVLFGAQVLGKRRA